MNEPTQALAAAVAERESEADDDLMHIVCEHDEDTALCGTDLAGAEWGEGLSCVVCEDLDDYYDELGICCPKGGSDQP
ncbi:hypothetical protein [Glycomyces tarimensis]